MNLRDTLNRGGAPEQRTDAQQRQDLIKGLKSESNQMQIENSPAPSGVEPSVVKDTAQGAAQFTRAVAGGVVASGNEIVTAVRTAFAGGDEETLKDIEADRNTTQSVVDEFIGKEDRGLGDDIAYSMAKYMSTPVAVAKLAGGAFKMADIGKDIALNMPKVAAAANTATVATTAGVLSYQETKSDLIKEGVDRQTASDAGLAAGAGMAVGFALPLTGPASATTKKQLAAYVAGGAVGSTAAISTGQYVAGEIVQESNPSNNEYQAAGQAYKNMATDPKNAVIGTVLGLALGGAVGAGKYKANKANKAEEAAVEALLKATPKTAEERLEAALEFKYSNLLTAEGKFTASDKYLISRNEQLLDEYWLTGNEDVLTRLEIPQVHRDALLLGDNKADTTDAYFDIQGIKEKRANGEERQSLHRANVEAPKVKTDGPVTKVARNVTATVVNTAAKVVGANPIMKTSKEVQSDRETKGDLQSLVGSAESAGDYNIANTGTAGKIAKLPRGISDMTIAEVTEVQNQGKAFAVGKYQMIPTTFAAAVKHMKLDPNTKLTPELQELIYKQYLVRVKRPAIHAFITGKSDSLQNAQLALAQEFASIGVPDGIPGKTKDVSYYPDVGNNKASVSSKQSGDVLLAQRERYQKLIKDGKSPEVAYDLSFKGDGGLSGKSEAVRIAERVLPSERSDGVARDEFDVAAQPDTLVRNDDGTLISSIADYKARPDTVGGELGWLQRRIFGDNPILAHNSKGDVELLTAKNRSVFDITRDVLDTYTDGTTEGNYSYAIENAFKDLSIQYAARLRDRAVKDGYTDEQAQTIYQNAYLQHQEGLKIGESKIFNEEYSNGLAAGLSNADALSRAQVAANLRTVKALSVVRNPRPDKDTLEEGKSIKDPFGNGRVEVISLNKESPKKTEQVDETAAKDTQGKDGNTKDGNTKDGNKGDTNTRDVTVRDSDGVTKTYKVRETVNPRDGSTVTTYTDEGGNRSSTLSNADGETVARFDLDTKIKDILKDDPDALYDIDGKTYTAAEVQQLIQDNKPIDVEAFALCSFR